MSDSSRDPFDPSHEATTPAASAEADAGAGAGKVSHATSPTGMSVATIRELFRSEARELLTGMSHRLAALSSDPGDRGKLADIAARGHALKGSAALAELPELSRAGEILQRAAEIAAEQAKQNRDAARNLLAATRAALEPAQRMLDGCLEEGAANQGALLAQLLGAFDPMDRRELEARIASEDDSQAGVPEFEEREDTWAGRGTARAPHPEQSRTTPGELPDPDVVAEDSNADRELRALLVETFLGELAELLSGIPDRLMEMIDPSRQHEACGVLGRVFHTVKGSAATAGRDDLRDLGKRLQDTFDAVLDERITLPLQPDFLDSLAAPLGDLFLAAGLEPPSQALDALRQATCASLLDDNAVDPGRPDGPGAPSYSPPLAADASDERRWQAPTTASSALDAAVEREIMDAFLLDSETALEASESALLQLERNPKDHKQLRILFRQFHTLKGAAGAVGLPRISEQLHAGETLLEDIIEGATKHDPEAIVEVLLDLVDSVAGLLDDARGVPHEHRVLRDVAARIDEVLTRATPSAERADGAPSPALDARPSEVASERARTVPLDADSTSSAGDDGGAVAPELGPYAAPLPSDPEAAIVRVHASRLDLLMNRVSELVVSRTRMEDTMGGVHELRDKLTSGRLRLHETIEGFRGFEFNPASASAAESTSGRSASSLVFSDLEFDKYDDFNLLARTLVELAADAGEIIDQLSGLVEAMADETRQVSKVTSSLQRTITGMRLLSLDHLFRRLQRPAREAARQVGKQVDLMCIGGEVQVDRALIDSLYGPLLHLLRNAVSHGIETLVERRAARKGDIGRVEIRATQRHGSVEITLRDDGRGLDFDAIYAKGISAGLLDAKAPRPSREELAMLIFRPGFSTRSEVTDLSGRGIGMDVVAGQVEQLRGSVTVDSRDGKGATFRIVLPLTAAIDQVVLLRAGTEVYALSHGPIETVLNIEPDDVVHEQGTLRVRIGTELVQAATLAGLVGSTGSRSPGTAVVLRFAQERFALLIDRIEAQREAVVRPLGRLFAGHPFVTSATFSGDGQVVFVLDAPRLESWLVSGAHAAAGGEAQETSDADAADGEAEETAAVLWADDSISVRKLAEHFLNAEGWSSRTAVDGRDALEKLRSGRFKLLVTDLEMPRMHGYELLHEIRNDPRLKDLPVIICSSRSSEKHRRAAEEAGATGYLTKPFTRETLATVVRSMVSPTGA